MALPSRNVQMRTTSLAKCLPVACAVPPCSVRRASGGNHFDDGGSVREELEELELLVRQRGVKELEPATDAVMTPVRAGPRKQADGPKRLPLHLFV
jgi:hypothetical protein